MTIKDILDAYMYEVKEHDFFSDPQKGYINEDGTVTLCLRDYNWYTTKEPMTDSLVFLRAIFEIDFICEYDEDDEFEYIKYSRYWNKVN